MLVHEPRHHIPITARYLHAGARIEHQEAFAIGVRLHLLDQVEIDDGGAMHALETARVEAFFEILHRLAQDQRVVAGIDAHVIARRIDAFDRIDIDTEDLAAILDVDELFEAIGGVLVVARCRRHVACRLRCDFGKHFLQFLHFGLAALFGHALADAVERVGEPRFLHRLHQIVGGLRLERANRMVGIGGDEDEQWRFDLHQPLNDGKTVESGHLNVQENQVGLVRLDRTDRFSAVRAFVDDLYVLMGGEPKLKSLDRKGFVIDENSADGHAASRFDSSIWSGISISTRKPPPGFDRVSIR
ncbi:conserved hypothetical protein [Sphingomonas sp. AX6]|nr:conserved hypothetical protein [Sphingomonas sp. AX6]